MIRNLLTTIASGAVLCTGLLSTAHAAEFTHLAYIPAGADVSTIRFEKARLVMVPATMRQSSDSRYCAEAAGRDSAGSAFCQTTVAESRTAAYKVTYSYSAPKASWDEGPQTRSTFDVMYRPEELTPAMRKALSARKQNRAEIADYFALNTSRETVKRAAIDESKSSFCEGGYVEGAWTKSDTNCADQIEWKNVASQAAYITVKVDPAAAVLSASIR